MDTQTPNPNFRDLRFFLKLPDSHSVWTWIGMCMFFGLVSEVNTYLFAGYLSPYLGTPAIITLAVVITWDLMIRLLASTKMPPIEALIIVTGIVVATLGYIFAMGSLLQILFFGAISFFGVMVSLPLFAYRYQIQRAEFLAKYGKGK